MNYVYVLISRKDNNRYIGSTPNLGLRLRQHNSGYVQSTKYRRPLELLYLQKCRTLTEARLLEKKYKRSRGSYNRSIEKGELLKYRGVV